jgi:hypothetical protein
MALPTWKTAEAQIEIPATSDPGSSTEVINLRFEYCHDFNNDIDGFHDVKVTASIDAGSRSPSTGTIEDLLGLAFDLNGENLSNLQIQDITIVDYQAPTGNNDQYTPNYIIEQGGIGDGDDPEPDFNSNGGSLQNEVFDASVQFSGGGAGDGTVQEASFIISSSAGDIDAAALLGGTSWYARLQSTDGGEDSSKMYLDALNVALFEPCEDEPPPPEEYQGLTPGYWKTHGPAPENSPGGQDNDWDNDSLTSGGTTEDRPVYGVGALKYDMLIFGGPDPIRWDLDPSKVVDEVPDLSVSQALSVQGGGKYELARHSMAAILNARDEDVNYFASESDICSWTAAALLGNQVQVGTISYDLQGLANLFKTNNELGLEPSLVAI